MALLYYPNEVVVLSTVVISVGCGLVIVCMALPCSSGCLYRLLMFGGKGRVVTCEMVVCGGFDVLRPIASGIELHNLSLAVSVSMCACVTNYMFNTHINTHTSIRKHTHTRSHAHAHIYKLRLFIIL